MVQNHPRNCYRFRYLAAQTMMTVGVLPIDKPAIAVMPMQGESKNAVYWDEGKAKGLPRLGLCVLFMASVF